MPASGVHEPKIQESSSCFSRSRCHLSNSYEFPVDKLHSRHGFRQKHCLSTTEIRHLPHVVKVAIDHITHLQCLLSRHSNGDEPQGLMRLLGGVGRRLCQLEDVRGIIRPNHWSITTVLGVVWFDALPILRIVISDSLAPHRKIDCSATCYRMAPVSPEPELVIHGIRSASLPPSLSVTLSSSGSHFPRDVKSLKLHFIAELNPILAPRFIHPFS